MAASTLSLCNTSSISMNMTFTNSRFNYKTCIVNDIKTTETVTGKNPRVLTRTVTKKKKKCFGCYIYRLLWETRKQLRFPH